MRIDTYRLIATPVPGLSDSRLVKVSHLADGNYRIEITMWDDESGNPKVIDSVINKVGFETIILPSLQGAFEKGTYFDNDAEIIDAITSILGEK